MGASSTRNSKNREVQYSYINKMSDLSLLPTYGEMEKQAPGNIPLPKKLGGKRNFKKFGCKTTNIAKMLQQ